MSLLAPYGEPMFLQISKISKSFLFVWWSSCIVLLTIPFVHRHLRRMAINYNDFLMPLFLQVSIVQTFAGISILSSFKFWKKALFNVVSAFDHDESFFRNPNSTNILITFASMFEARQWPICTLFFARITGFQWFFFNLEVGKQTGVIRRLVTAMARLRSPVWDGQDIHEAERKTWRCRCFNTDQQRILLHVY